MRWFVLILLLIIPALAGCADDDGEHLAGEAPGATDPMAAEGLALPEWQIGDHWTYTSRFGARTIIVTGETATSWTVDTDDEDLAFFHDRNPISYLGDIRKTDLAGSTETGAIKWLDFPLVDGHTWTTRWDDLDLTLTAYDQGNGVFRIEGTDGETLRREAVYSEATRWFDSIRWLGEDGSEQFALEVTSKGRGWTGEYVRVQADLQFEGSGVGPSTDFTVHGTLDGRGEDADVYLILTMECTQQGVAFGVGAIESAPAGMAGGDGSGWTYIGGCPYSEAFFDVIASPVPEERFGYFAIGPEGFTWDFQVFVRFFERLSL